MKIAMPSENGLLFGHFGGAPQFEVFTIDNENNIINHEKLNSPPHENCSTAIWLNELGVNVVIVSGIGQGAINHLNNMNIKILAGAEIKKTDDLLKDFIGNSLKLIETTCNHDHHGCHN